MIRIIDCYATVISDPWIFTKLSSLTFKVMNMDHHSDHYVNIGETPRSNIQYIRTLVSMSTIRISCNSTNEEGEVAHARTGNFAVIS